MALVDTSGQLVKFTLYPGNRNESPLLPELMEGIETRELIADKGFDSKANRKMLKNRAIRVTIPMRRIGARKPIWYDTESYKTRHLVENWFGDAKQFRGIATRYCKLAESYEAFVNLAGWYLATKKPKLDSTGVLLT